MERVETRKLMVSLKRLNMDFGWSRAFASVRMYVGEVLCACGDIKKKYKNRIVYCNQVKKMYNHLFSNVLTSVITISSTVIKFHINVEKRVSSPLNLAVVQW